MSSPNQHQKSGDTGSPGNSQDASKQQSGLANALAEHAASTTGTTTPTYYRSGYMTSTLQNNPDAASASDNLNVDPGHNVNLSQHQQVEVQFDSPVRRSLQAALRSDSDLVVSAATSAATTPTPSAFLGHSPDDAALAMAASVLYSGTNAEAAAAVAAAAAAAGASGPFGSPEAFLSGENIDLTNSGQQPTPAHSLATSPYNPYDDDESDVITPITNNKIRMGTGKLGVGELSHGIQVPLHALGPPNMPIIEEQNSNVDSPPAESVVSGKLNNNELSPPVLDSASVTSKSFVEDDVSRNSGSIGGGGGNGGIRPRRGRVRSCDHAHSAAANNDVFMTGLQQPQLDDAPEESSFGGGAPAFRGGGEGVPPVGLGGPPPHPLAGGGAGGGGIGRNTSTPNRPPRAPPLPPQSRPHGHHVGSVQFSHRRGASLGDYSILSVLTEPSLEEGDVGTGPPTTSTTSGDNRRKISWDFDASSPRLSSPRGATGQGPLLQVPMSILQPVLSEGNLKGLDSDADSESEKEAGADATAAKNGVNKQNEPAERFFSAKQVVAPALTFSPGFGAGAKSTGNPISPQLQSPPGREMKISHSTETIATRNTAAEKENADSKDNSSWDEFQGVTVRPAIPHSDTKVITVADVAASPHEEEAETSILKAIERRESERKERDRRSISISSKKVAGMNDTEAERATAAFAENEDAEEGRESMKQHAEKTEAPPQVSPRNVTRNASNKMVDLTEQLMMMQMMNVSIRSKGSAGAENGDQLNAPEVLSPPTSSFAHYGVDREIYGVDALVKDGAKLFRRSKHNKRTDRSTNSGPIAATDRAPADNGGTPTAHMRWGKIRGAVVTGSAVKKEKLDEDSGSGDIEDQRDKSSRENTTADGENAPDNGNGAPTYRDKGRLELRSIGHALKEEVSPRRAKIVTRSKWVLFGMILPCLLVASVLFYGLKNPLVCTPIEESDPCASWSWWIIFVGIRQPMTLAAARVVEVFAVNIFSLRTRITLRIWGPFITLWIVQSKGWPILITIWAMIDFIVLYGRSDWTNHWLFWQHAIDMCNANNPAGNVLDSSTYTRVLSAAITGGVLTGLKRLWLSSYLGTRTCDHYSSKLEHLMQEMVLISEVANLSREIRSLHRAGITRPCPGAGRLQQWNASLATHGDDNAEATIGAQEFDLHATTKVQLYQLLGEWEEPDIPPSARKNDTPWNDAQGSVNDVLQFRQAVSLLDTPFPFSLAFGKSSTREECVESAQNVYDRLMLQTPNEDMLPFETMSFVALDRNDSIDDAKMKRLIRLFRPDRSGKLSKLDFIKSVDSVYKKFRMLRASIHNSSQIDEAFESLINTLYYFLLWMLLLSIMDLNPWPFIASLTGVLVSFAFCFGSDASKYFEGLLLIFVRRPYDIGDKIAISPVDNVSNPDGSSAWFVEGVSLFTTTARYATTNEVATFSNGSLANSRIINAARSPKAQVYVYFKFSLEVSHEKITLFRDSLESFVKARPREWIALTAFRTKSVEADLGYVEYSVVLVHREKWQSLPAILDSKTDIQSFAVEVSRRLGIRYVAPPMGVMLDTAPAASPPTLDDAIQNAATSTDSSEREALMGLARQFLRKD